MNPLLQLRSLGQSVWVDNIERKMLDSGELRRLITEDGISGLTSNPTIFQKAISSGEEYNLEIARLVAQGLSTADIMDCLIARDLTDAADLFEETFRQTDTVDGWVSIEVAPSMAHEVTKTVAEVRRLRALVPRQNVLVKVPATKAGVTAIQQLIAEGISINVTLIFSLERYAEIMEAYISGQEQLVERRAAGEELPAPEAVRSVASFFVSRVDTLVDKKLDELIAEADDQGRKDRLTKLKGRAAVANAKMAYKAFRETFSGERWERLSREGARVQRPLWASTSTKNPEYRDVLYVEELIGPDTVNTMPQATIDAFREHGVVEETVTSGVDEAQRLLDELEAEGISMREVTLQLEVEGVDAFSKSFDSLYATLDEKQRVVAAAR